MTAAVGLMGLVSIDIAQEGAHNEEESGRRIESHPRSVLPGREVAGSGTAERPK